MRKRTYTALVNEPYPTECGRDVLYDSNIKHNASESLVYASSSHTNKRVDTHYKSTHTSLGSDHVDTIVNETVMGAALDTSSIPSLEATPLTTIHNLVGTCEISSSIIPIDLEYVYKCLPNSFYDRKRCKYSGHTQSI
jgi:hypothetical protein